MQTVIKIVFPTYNEILIKNPNKNKFNFVDVVNGEYLQPLSIYQSVAHFELRQVVSKNKLFNCI